MTKLMFCGCKHPYQDARYGKGQRVHNRAKPKATKASYRCTVCAVVKDA